MKKRQNKHLFARACRVLGRFLLTIGAVLCVASAIFAIAPVLFPSEIGTLPDSSQLNPTNIQAQPVADQTAASISNPALILPAIVIIIITIAALILAFRHYNRSVRNFIARIAKASHFEIHVTELTLATITWTIVNIVVAFNAPVFSIVTFPALIFNNLFFIFAWTSYGCPAYSI